MSTTPVVNTDIDKDITSLTVRLARANELNLKKILAKGEEVEDKDILDALVDPSSRSNLLICEEKGCFVKVDNRVDQELETFTPVDELTLVTSKAPIKNRNTRTIKPLSRNVNAMAAMNISHDKWRSYAIDFSLVMAFLLIVLYGFSSS